MQLVNCPKCGKRLPQNTAICPDCGYEFPQSHGKHTEKAQRAMLLILICYL